MLREYIYIYRRERAVFATLRTGLLCQMLLQIFEVAPSLHMVELRKAGGDTLEFHKVLLLHSNYLRKLLIYGHMRFREQISDLLEISKDDRAYKLQHDNSCCRVITLLVFSNKIVTTIFWN